MLSKGTEYAIRALVFIQLQNWKGKRPGVTEIAEQIETPTAYTAKSLQTLTKHELIESMKGRGGGFFFGDVENLSMYKVIKVMDGDVSLNKCGFGLKSCSKENPCPLHDKYEIVREGYLQIVKTETIQSLSKKIQEGKAVLNLARVNE